MSKVRTAGACVRCRGYAFAQLERSRLIPARGPGPFPGRVCPARELPCIATAIRDILINNGDRTAAATPADRTRGRCKVTIESLHASLMPGNFHNLFYYAPGGNKDGMQLNPVSEVAAKDEFFNIKNITRDDLLAAHRVPPQLLGIVSSDTGGFGAADTAARVFGRNEIEPLQAQFLAFNEWAGEEIVRFMSYSIEPAITS